jgi:lipoprotein NlpD
MRNGLVVLGLCLASCTPSLVDYETGVHVVRPGETLYAIAWRYGIDHQTLARLNGIDDPNLILVGQRLRLRGSATAPAAAQAARRAPLPAPVVLPAPTWRWPTAGAVVNGFGKGVGLDSGIAIAGQSGQAILAAAGGQVVYAGTGLIGYGQLIIIKHNDTYLSAYGHNADLMVGEGETVRAGQPIAHMGIGPERRAQLHFEIRRNGVPVDPIRMLPARGG